ncbi:MAG: hypothetical protein WA945_10895, partial [Arcobacteraceae bacterium]
GCVNTNVLTKKVEIPQWYLSVPLNNSVFIYGEGDSKHSISDAKNNALSTMASNLVVSVNSSTSSTTQSSMNGVQNSYSKDVRRDVKVTVEKIKFTNAITEKSEQVDESFYVLMKVNRQELFTNKKKEFDIIDDRLTTQFNALNKYGKLEKIHILQSMYSTIKTAKTQVIVLNAINNNFDQAPYIRKYDSYIDMISELKNNSSVMVKTNDQKGYFADALTNVLNQNQYKVSNNNKSDVVISLNNKVKYSIARGWNIAKVSTTISVILNNKIISNTIINSVGRSSTSKESALENASQNFISQIKEKTLDKVIFSK